MVQAWWGAAIAVPVIFVQGLVSGRSRVKKVESEGRGFRDADGLDPSFCCERVCTSDRLLRRLGTLAKARRMRRCLPRCRRRSRGCASRSLRVGA